MAELPDQPLQGQRAEIDDRQVSHQPADPLDRSNSPPRSSRKGQSPSANRGYHSFVQAHNIRGARKESRSHRRDDSVPDSTTHYQQTRQSAPNRSEARRARSSSISEQATMRQPPRVDSSGAPDESSSKSTHTHPNARRQQPTRPLPESTSDSGRDSAYSPRLPRNRVPPTQFDSLRGYDEYNRRPEKPTSTSTYPVGSRHHSSERGNYDRPQSEPARAAVHRRSGSRRRDVGTIEQQPVSTSAYPPVSRDRR